MRSTRVGSAHGVGESLQDDVQGICRIEGLGVADDGLGHERGEPRKARVPHLARQPVRHRVAARLEQQERGTRHQSLLLPLGLRLQPCQRGIGAVESRTGRELQGPRLLRIGKPLGIEELRIAAGLPEQQGVEGPHFRVAGLGITRAKGLEGRSHVRACPGQDAIGIAREELDLDLPRLEPIGIETVGSPQRGERLLTRHPLAELHAVGIRG